MALGVILVGAGQRGFYVYGDYARRHPADLRVIGVVEPDPDRRTRFGDAHGLPVSRRWAHAGEVDIEAEAWVVASGDQDHLEPALTAFDRGAHVLAEKPLAATLDDCVRMVGAAQRAGRQLHVAHVLRYAPFFTALRREVHSGRLGDIVTVEHRENVAHWHMAHSFVRGNWARAEAATPMIVQKCCHDFDVLQWNLRSLVGRLHSFGSLVHFRPEHAPAGAPARCTDGCPVGAGCPYEATRIYMNMSWTGWPVHVITDDLSPPGRMDALRNGPYGRCVYTVGSDVVDHQVVSMEREDGSTTVLVMHGHAADEARTMRYDGTRATLRARFGRAPAIEVQDHRTGRIDPVAIPAPLGGHGGGDDGSIAAFVAAVRAGTPSRTDGREALESHLLAFAAEESRRTGKPIDVRARRAALTARLQSLS